MIKTEANLRQNDDIAAKKGVTRGEVTIFSRNLQCLFNDMDLIWFYYCAMELMKMSRGLFF